MSAAAAAARAAAFLSESPEATVALGAALGERLGPGDVVGLVGDLGSGKTVFAKGVGRGLGIGAEAVTSPTFTLVHVHEGRCPLYHLDLYRIRAPEALEALGWDEAVGGRGVAVVEWAERAAGWLPADRLEVTFVAANEAARRIVVAARGDRSRAHLAVLCAAPAAAGRRVPDEPAALAPGWRDHGGTG